MSRRKGWSFDAEIVHKGHTLRVVGEVSRSWPGTGPTYDCGGTPPEGGDIEALTIFLVRKTKTGTKERLLEDPDGDLADKIEDAIYELAPDEDDRDYDGERKAKLEDA